MGISTREVEKLSRQVARAHGRPDFYISHSSLADIELSDSTPSIYKLYTLSVVYRMSFVDLVSLYGIDLDLISRNQMTVKLPKTHLVAQEVYDKELHITFPLKFHENVRIHETNLLSRMVEAWGDVPIAFLQHLGIRERIYGFIGMKDYTMYPLIRPGSFVQIDANDKKAESPPWDNEFERPIYFFKLREGYACGWCQLESRALNIIPHSLSPSAIRRFNYPEEVEIVGRVTGVAMPLLKVSRRSPNPPNHN